MSARRLAAVMLVATAVLGVTTACSGLPTNGPVNEGLSPVDDGNSDIFLDPDPPQPGASQEQIVDGFIRAGSGSGPANDWAKAQLYLAPSFRDTWQPADGVTVDREEDRHVITKGDGEVEMTVTPEAIVDDTGAYALSSAQPITLDFELAKQADGEWRITKAPDGIVLDADVFPSVFSAYALEYFDPSWQYLVPDVRWFPRTNAATFIATALINGEPSPWLKDSVAAFPGNVRLARRSVPVDSGIAQVELSGATLDLDAATLSRMQAQLEASLGRTATGGVQITVAGVPVDAVAAATRSTKVDPRSLVQNAAGFGFLTGSEVEPIDGISTAMQTLTPTAIELSRSHEFAAVRIDSGVVARVQADRKVIELDTRPGLIDPTVDPQGYTWSVPGAAPSALQAALPGAAPIAVAGAWPTASQISAISVSRDGTRIVALGTSEGASWAWVAGIVRNGEGVPQRLGDAFALAVLAGSGVDVAWIDDVTVGIVVRDGDASTVIQQPIGGAGTQDTGPAGTSAIAGGGGTSAVRLRTEDGTLYVRSGTNWQKTADGIQVLGTQQGPGPAQ